jgi:hypothetical protein
VARDCERLTEPFARHAAASSSRSYQTVYVNCLTRYANNNNSLNHSFHGAQAMNASKFGSYICKFSLGKTTFKACLIFACLAPLTSAIADQNSQKRPHNGPSIDETINFIHDYILGCGNFSGNDYQSTDTGSDGTAYPITEKMDEKWIDFHLDGKSIKYTALVRYTWHRPQFNIKTVASPRKLEGFFKLSDLSPDLTIGKDSGGVWHIDAHCTSGNCNNVRATAMTVGGKYDDQYMTNDNMLLLSQTSIDALAVPPGDPDKVGITNSFNSFNIYVCGGHEDAERVRKAMSHAIYLEGGKKAIF